MRPVFARHAASLLLWRRGEAGPEVLMGVRGAGHRFMPNRLVFPGGRGGSGRVRARRRGGAGGERAECGDAGADRAGYGEDGWRGRW